MYNESIRLRKITLIFKKLGEKIMKTQKEMRKAIRELVDGRPNGELSLGIYFDKMTQKYVHILNCHQGCKYNQKMTIEEFYDRYIYDGPTIYLGM